jgi:hypothetical protein
LRVFIEEKPEEQMSPGFPGFLELRNSQNEGRVRDRRDKIQSYA